MVDDLEVVVLISNTATQSRPTRLAFQCPNQLRIQDKGIKIVYLKYLVWRFLYVEPFEVYWALIFGLLTELKQSTLKKPCQTFKQELVKKDERQKKIIWLIYNVENLITAKEFKMVQHLQFQDPK